MTVYSHLCLLILLTRLECSFYSSSFLSVTLVIALILYMKIFHLYIAKYLFYTFATVKNKIAVNLIIISVLNLSFMFLL